MASSGTWKRHDGFNPMQIRDGMVVRINKDGLIKTIHGKVGK